MEQDITDKGIKFDDKLECYCYDCAQKDIKTRIMIKDKKPVNGKVMTFKKGEEMHLIFKCDNCYEDDPKSIMVKGQKCEVYSRVTGYLRPINQWNPGKQEEFRERKYYKFNAKK